MTINNIKVLICSKVDDREIYRKVFNAILPQEYQDRLDLKGLNTLLTVTGLKFALDELTEQEYAYLIVHFCMHLSRVANEIKSPFKVYIHLNDKFIVRFTSDIDAYSSELIYVKNLLTNSEVNTLNLIETMNVAITPVKPTAFKKILAEITSLEDLLTVKACLVFKYSKQTLCIHNLVKPLLVKNNEMLLLDSLFQLEEVPCNIKDYSMYTVTGNQACTSLNMFLDLLKTELNAVNVEVRPVKGLVSKHEETVAVTPISLINIPLSLDKAFRIANEKLFHLENPLLKFKGFRGFVLPAKTLGDGDLRCEDIGDNGVYRIYKVNMGFDYNPLLVNDVLSEVLSKEFKVHLTTGVNRLNVTHVVTLLDCNFTFIVVPNDDDLIYCPETFVLPENTIKYNLARLTCSTAYLLLYHVESPADLLNYNKSLLRHITDIYEDGDYEITSNEVAEFGTIGFVINVE